MSWYDDAIADIERDEGLRLAAYQDGLGVWTIGYGHTREVTPGQTCSAATAKLWLSEDIGVAMRDLDIHCPWWTSAPDGVRRGLLNMCFNLGWPRLSRFTATLDAGAQSQWGWMADECLRSKWAQQVGERAIRISALFRFAEMSTEYANA